MFLRMPVRLRLPLRLKFAIFVGGVVAISITGIFYWMYYQSKIAIMDAIDREARILLKQVLITREWVADHGGVYLRKGPDAETNPFLPGSDIKDTKGRTYVLRNPAMVTRELSEYANKAGLYRFHITSLKFRNPANSPTNFERKALLEFERLEYVGDILNSGKHLLALINDILDLSKVESGRMELELSRFSLKDTLNASMTMLKEKAMKHGIRLNLEIEPEADIEIEADERKLKQIVFNLLSNAVKFTPDNGSVRLSAKRVQRLRDFVEISVVDTGIGIRPEDMPKLFTEFSQLESAYNKKYEGTGLGLALAKKLVELHRGRIWAESEFGKGSKFTFIIPIQQRTIQAQ
jgi:signal transduction histidine kinase